FRAPEGTTRKSAPTRLGNHRVADFDRHSCIADDRRDLLYDSLVFLHSLLAREFVSRRKRLRDMRVLANQSRICGLSVDKSQQFLDVPSLLRLHAIDQYLCFEFVHGKHSFSAGRFALVARNFTLNGTIKKMKTGMILAETLRWTFRFKFSGGWSLFRIKF